MNALHITSLFLDFSTQFHNNTTLSQTENKYLFTWNTIAISIDICGAEIIFSTDGYQNGNKYI